MHKHEQLNLRQHCYPGEAELLLLVQRSIIDAWQKHRRENTFYSGAEAEIPAYLGRWSPGLALARCLPPLFSILFTRTLQLLVHECQRQNEDGWRQMAHDWLNSIVNSWRRLFLGNMEFVMSKLGVLEFIHGCCFCNSAVGRFTIQRLPTV